MSLQPWEDREWRPYAEGASIYTDTEEGRRCVAVFYGAGAVELTQLVAEILHSIAVSKDACPMCGRIRDTP